MDLEASFLSPHAAIPVNRKFINFTIFVFLSFSRSTSTVFVTAGSYVCVTMALGSIYILCSISFRLDLNYLHIWSQILKGLHESRVSWLRGSVWQHVFSLFFCSFLTLSRLLDPYCSSASASYCSSDAGVTMFMGVSTHS